MSVYYFTFMNKQATKDHYVKIIADSNDLARQCMFDHFGDKWMTDYRDTPENPFSDQIKEYGLSMLLSITVIDHGHGSVEYKRTPVECAVCGKQIGWEDTFDRGRSLTGYTCGGSCTRDFYD